MTTDKNLLEDIYVDLLNTEIILDLGSVPSPSYIQGKIVECNNLQRKVEKHFLKIRKTTTLLERNFRIKKVGIEVSKRDILTNNLQAKKLPTVKEREAFVEGLLENDFQELLTLENDLNEHKSVLDSIKLVERNLKGTNSDIKSLIRVLEQQLNRLNVGSEGDPEVSGLLSGLGALDALELEDEIDMDDIEDSVDYTTTDEDTIPSTPVEDEDDISIDIDEDDIGINIDDTDDECIIDADDLGDQDIEDTLNNIGLDTDETVSSPISSTSEDILDYDEDPDGLPDLDSFLNGEDTLGEIYRPTDECDNIVDASEDEITVEAKEPPKKGSITSDNIEVPVNTKPIDIDDILIDLDDEEDTISIDSDFSEDKDEKEDSTSSIMDIDFTSIDVDDEEDLISVESDLSDNKDEKEDSTSSIMDIDFTSIDVDDEETIVAEEEDKDPYGLGDPIPGSLSEILSGNKLTHDDTSEKEEEENEIVKDKGDTLVEETEDEGIDIDALLDAL